MIVRLVLFPPAACSPQRASVTRRRRLPSTSPSWSCTLLLVASMLGGCSRGEPEGSPPAHASSEGIGLGVVLDATEQQKLGIEVAAIAAAQFQSSIEGPARVLDARAVVAAMADLGKAEADSRTSQAGLQRARQLNRLDKAVSAETLEAAERDAAAAEAELRVARARAVLEFGARAPWLDGARREQLIAALATGATLLVSASFPSGLGAAEPSALTLRRIGASVAHEGHSAAAVWTATEVWLGPADPGVPGPTLLALLPAPSELAYGERLMASVGSGPSLTGALVPLSAVVLAGGEPWCYVQVEQGFERRRVSLSRPLPQGYFAETGFAPGERVVVAGAGLLLAREVGGGAEED
jgi:hypothetical protein